jgi:hypothetical protein
MTYKIPFLNGDAKIVDPVVTWTFAGFSTSGTATVTIVLTTSKAVFCLELTGKASADDRSNEAIDAFVLNELEQYKV